MERCGKRLLHIRSYCRALRSHQFPLVFKYLRLTHPLNYFSACLLPPLLYTFRVIKGRSLHGSHNA